MEHTKRTHAELAIRQALLSLMKQQPYGSITVMQIAREADINRKTFYAYYTGKEDCFCRCIREIFAALFDCFLHAKHPPCEAGCAALERDIRRFLQALELRRDDLDTLITGETAALAFAAADDIIIGQSGLFFLDEASPRDRLYKRLYLESIRNAFFILIDACTSCGGVDADTLCGAARSLLLQSPAQLLGYSPQD